MPSSSSHPSTTAAAAEDGSCASSRAAPSLSLTAWGVVLAYGPARSPLAFVAAQPICRIAAEARIVPTGDDADDDDDHFLHGSHDMLAAVTAENAVASARAREAYDAAWTAWARALPFGEWWVSDVAEHVMPTEQGFDGEVRFMGEADDVHETQPEHRGPSTRQHRPWPPRLRATGPQAALRDVAAPAWPHCSPPQALRRCRCETYFDFKQRRQHEQRRRGGSGGASLSDSASVASGAGFTHAGGARGATRRASRGIALADGPHLGTCASSAAVKAGYRGGVHVGWLVSFLVPTTAAMDECDTEDAATERERMERTTLDDRCGALPDAAPSPGAAPALTQQARKAALRVPWRRVVHWEAAAEDDMHRARRREPHVGDTQTAQLDSVASADDDLVRGPSEKDEALSQHRASAHADASGGVATHSWHLTHWWLARPLVARVESTASPPATARVSDLAKEENAVLPSPQLRETASALRDVPAASLHVYGCHPSALPSLLGEAPAPPCRDASGFPHRDGPVRCTQEPGHGTAAAVDAATDFHAQTRGTHGELPLHRCCDGVVAAVHVHECRSMAGQGPGRDGGDGAPLGPLLRQLQDVACCARLSVLDVNFEERDGGGGVDWRAATSAGATSPSVLGTASSPPASEAALPPSESTSGTGAGATTAQASRPASTVAVSRHEGGGAFCAASEASPQPPSVGGKEQWRMPAPHGLPHAMAAQHTPAAAARRLTEVHVTCSATLCDVNALGALRGVRLIDVSRNARLTDAGIVELRRSPVSLRVLDVSGCPRIDAAAAELVRALPQLEEAYFSGTGVTDVTFRAIAQTLCGRARLAGAACVDGDGPGRRRRRLRVLHLCGCRHLRHPLETLARVGGGHVRRLPGSGAADASGGGEAHVLAWATLEELRLTAAAAPATASDHGSSASDAEGEEPLATAAAAPPGEEAGALGQDVSMRSQTGAVAPPHTAVGLRTTSSTAPQPLLLSSKWRRLTILVITDTNFRCALGDVGPLPALECLSLLRCSRAVETRLGAAAAADAGDDGGGGGLVQHHPPFFRGLERCTGLHTVHLDGCDTSLFYPRSSSDVRRHAAAAAARASMDSTAAVSGLECLARLPALENLSLSHTGLRDADVTALATTLMREGGAAGAAGHAFRRLCLRACGRVSQLGVLAALAALRALDLSDTAVRQETLDLLGTPAAATGATGTAVTAGGVAADPYARSDAPALQWLSCAACSLVVDLTPLSRLRYLRWLDVSHTPITTQTVSALRGCPALTHLSLKNCGGVRHLRDVMAIASLEVLNAQGTGLYDSEADDEEEQEEEAAASAGDGVSTDGASVDDIEPHGAPSRGPRCGPHGGHGRGVLAVRTPPCDALGPPLSSSAPPSPLHGGAALPQGGHPHRRTRPERQVISDVFPDEDATLRVSRVHTLLLSHTHVRRIRRLGLLPSLMCLELNRTAVSDVELVKFVVTGIRAAAAAARTETPTSPAASRSANASATAGGIVVHSLRRLLREADPLCGVWRATQVASDAGARPRGPGGPPLRVLSLQYCRGLFSAGVLGLCPYLVKLDLSASNITGDGLVGLQRSPSLAQLRLVACKGVHDLRVLGQLTSLTELDGSGCNVHGDRVVGGAAGGGAGVHDTESAAPGRATSRPVRAGAVARAVGHRGPSTAPAPRVHSDLLSELGLRSDEAAAICVIAQGEVCDVAQPFASRCGPHATVAQWPALQRLVLDGCVNVHGFAGVGGLPALLELSLCNCPGVTAASVAELESWGVPDRACGRTPVDCTSSVVDESAQVDTADEVPRGAQVSPPSTSSGTVTPLTHASPPLPVLRSLHLSACRHLRGPLTGLTRLPQLQRVHVDHCAIASLDEVEPSLRSRTAL